LVPAALLLIALALRAELLSTSGAHGPPEQQSGGQGPPDQQQIMRPDAFEIVALADGVRAVLRRDPPDDAANGNVLVIVNAEDVVVVDANLTPASAGATIAAIRKLTPKPVRYVINTHWHDDHVLGNGAYADAFPGIEFIGHPFTRQQILETVGPTLEKNKVVYRDELAGLEQRMEKGIRRDGKPYSAEDRVTAVRVKALLQAILVQMPLVRIVPPTLLVSDSLTLRRGDREIRVVWLGRGNTAGDLVVHLPKEGVLATGDLLVHPIPFSFGSFLGDWVQTLSRVEALGAKVIMPGHGELQRDTTYLSSVRELLDAMRTQMEAAVKKGMTLEKARESLDLASYRQKFAGSDKIRNQQFSDFFVTPASERAYLEAKGELGTK
jgi:glyoxylase-like metal-dependent hydrolase (beta-lactamase superfamily II)